VTWVDQGGVVPGWVDKRLWLVIGGYWEDFHVWDDDAVWIDGIWSEV